ncbi:MAG TPA: helix-turn-helix domain-containing protein [Stellaceae bacterium]|nr:helix-turn-helix domain-containing protein [Stellaceae bacterium]
MLPATAANKALLSRDSRVPRANGINNDAADFSFLNGLSALVSLKRDGTVFTEGDHARYFFRVVTGAVRSCQLLADGRRHIGEFFLPGDFIALDADHVYRFTAEAVTETTLRRYARSAIDRSLEPRLHRQLLAVLSRQLVAAQQQMLLLGRKTATERVASFLLTMAARSKNAEHMSLPMTRSDIADHLGLTTETVSRAFSQFKTQGVIGLEGAANVIVQDGDALEDLAEAA